MELQNDPKTLAFEPRQPELIEPPVSSDLDKFVAKAAQIAERRPEILAAIEADQLDHGLRKKARRLADRQYLAGLTARLPDLETPQTPESIKLEDGRPRMPALVVFIFLLLRGWIGGPKTVDFRLILRESITLRRFLSNQGMNVPGPSTVLDNINAVSQQTQDLCLRAQLGVAREEGLDDFKRVRIDSTAAAANSKYPTDSGLICAHALRMNQLFATLAKSGLPDLRRLTEARKCAELAREIEICSKQIGMLSGKQKVKEKRVGLYQKIYSRVDRMVKKYRRLLDRAGSLVDKAQDIPSRVEVLKGFVGLARRDLTNIIRIREYSAERVLEDKQVAAGEKVLSISDLDAATIKKGGWDVTFGYRPQLAFSGRGLVVAHDVPRGNAADSGQLENVLEQIIGNTKITPMIVTVDDGYTNTAVRAAFLEKYAVDDKQIIFSIAGSKGRGVIDEETYQSEAYREARHDRSAAESCIYTLKAMHNYGDVMRRGLAAVNHEQMCKVLAYNIRRLVRLEDDARNEIKKQMRQKQRQRQAQSLAAAA